MMTSNSNNKTSSSSADQKIATRPPVVLWAQRADKVFLTIQLEDCKEPTIKLEKDKLFFQGRSDSIQQNADHCQHEVTIDFYKPINVDDSKYSVRARNTEFIIIKEDSNNWWPRLTKDSAKHHWLKIDFPKWQDEDDSEDENQFGGMGGMGGMGGGGQPDFSELMQQFGGMSGAGGPGGMGDLGAGDDEEFESDDDDTEQKPPELEE